MSAWATTANALAILQGVGAGFVAGFASGLLGVSSGGILVPAISAVLGVDQHIAQGASLIAQIPPTSLSGVLQYREHGKSVSWRWLIWLSLGFVAGGALGAVCAGGLSDRVLRWLFVGYLVLLALLAVLRRSPSPDQAGQEDRPAHASWAILVAIGAGGGFSSGLLGIGGGLGVTALSIALLRLGQHRAQALTLMLLSLPLTAPSGLVYVVQGWPLPWWSILGLIIGLALGTAGGAALANRLSERVLKPIFVALVLGMAAYMAMR